MVKNGITVFARVKPEKNRKDVVNYEIHRRPKKHMNEDFLVITAPQKCTEYIDNRPESWNFSFHSIFEHKVSQDEVFERVARPIVDSVFDGYNATIFTYGQTGSGKTYTITGEPEILSERGILPRTLQYIFDIVRKNPENLYTVEVAYLEIYNENGYDLLLERKEREAATRLEDLPRVTIQEDESGTMHLKNLSIRIVRDEKEALQLLVDGDAYRAISDTPMNPRSSRSHCIFTIVISVKKFGADRYSRAKIHLVDLAGSERVYKCAIQGTILTEAKHINLSLHFLEQVIVCLGQDNVTHVPYRNSLLTSVLKDSLGGNCLTTMLATLSVSNFNLEETISTCRFAQRVALVKNDVNLTFEIDIKSENILLKMENEKLRRQIEELKNQKFSQVSNLGSAEYYKDLVVQRDQEISHLIDLLKKEKSRRKSASREIHKTTKETLKHEKCTQFPSNFSLRNFEQDEESSKLKIGGNIKNFLQKRIPTSPKNNKIEDNEIKENINSSRKIDESQISQINVPILNLDEKKYSEENIITKNNKCSSNESPKFSIEIQKTKKINAKEMKNNEPKKVEETNDCSLNREINGNTPGNKIIEIIETPKSEIQKLDTQRKKYELSHPKNFENCDSDKMKPKAISPSQNCQQKKCLETEFSPKDMNNLPKSCNQRDEIISPASDFKNLNSDFKIPNILHNGSSNEKKMAESFVRDEDKRFSNPTKIHPDAKTDNIVKIPLPLTGDPDIDEEIIAFYNAKKSGNFY